MMSEHTPGPWRASTYHGDFYVFDACGNMVADHHEGDTPGIARMRGIGCGRTVAEREANAHLIAAAPTMRDALAALVKRVEREAAERPADWKDHACAECGGSIVQPGFQCARHAATAALAVAPGKSA